jgi:serine/threonine protein kinase/Tol biopolymer transport system component
VALAPGTRIGSYQITSEIGAGGMGVVYRARDTKLGRHVAIKVLPDAFAQDAERLVRFEREARVLASLNHPYIATVHGVEDAGGTRALVMELVEGETLAQRLAHGPMTVPEALAVARQIADALDAAHEKGIIHRDLKPANIMVTSSGVVKLLDFGLARPVAFDRSSSDLSQTLTQTVAVTQEGMIVGTVAYMSPEQARGKALDERTDIWAFGCLLYEMLTGRAAFGSATVSDTVAQILGAEPEWGRLPEKTPPLIRRLVQRCLEKDVKRRLHHSGDARIEIDDVFAAPASSWLPEKGQGHLTPVSMWRTAAIGLGVVALVAGGISLWLATRSGNQLLSPRTVRFSIDLQPGQSFSIDAGLPVILAISPDGNRIVYAARDVDGDRLYIRGREDLEASPIPGTEGAIGPFFSPDGQWIAFGSGGMLRVVPLAGGAPRTLTEAPNLAGASWGAGDAIVYSGWSGGLLKVSAQGGRPEPLTMLDERQGDSGHVSPHVLPGGTAVLFTVDRPTGNFIEAAEIATGRRRPIVEGRNPVYLPTGHLVFARGSALFRVPFDVERLEVTGPAVRLLDDIRTDGNDTHYALSGRGTLAYIPGVSRDSRLVWLDRQGRSRPLDSERRAYSHPRISPDAKRVVVSLLSQTPGFNEIWVYDADRGTRARLSPTGAVSRPIWTSDGRRITFQMTLELYSVPADDSAGPQRVLGRGDGFDFLFPLAWSRDGRALLFSAPNRVTNRDVWTMSGDGTTTPFLVTARDERAAMFSPDGRWVVYAAREPGRDEQIYVQPFPGPGGRMVVSPGGGVEPVWSPTGGEIFYRSVDGTRVMSVDVRSGSTLTVGEPRVLFAARFGSSEGGYWSSYDVSPDGQKFLMLETDEISTPRVNVVLDWADVLRRPNAEADP